jgi:multidrug resistance protein, MATE family
MSQLDSSFDVAPQEARSRGPWRKEVRATAALAGPLALTQLAQIAIATTDVILLGRYAPSALAAAGLGGSFYFTAWVFGAGLVSAVAPLAAQAVALHDGARAGRIAAAGFWIALLFGLPICALLAFVHPILSSLGQPEALAGPAQTYLRFAEWGYLPSLWFVALRTLLAAFSKTRAALIVTLGGIAGNGILGWVLIFGHAGVPALGLIGSGLAGAITNVLMCLALLLCVAADRHIGRIGFFSDLRRLGPAAMGDIIRLGAPIGGTMLMEVGLFAVAIQIMGTIGSEALAAHQIAIQCAAIAFMVPIGIGQAATIRIAGAAALRDRAGVRRAFRVALALGGSWGIIVGLGFWTFGRFLVGLFLDLGTAANAGVAELAVTFLVVAALFQIADTTQGVTAGALRGLKDTRIPMMLAALGYFGIGFPACLALAFPLRLGGMGVWIGLSLALGVVAVFLLARFLRLERRV